MSPPQSFSQRHGYGQYSSAPKCSITWNAEIGGYNIQTPYNEQFIATLKQLIPAGQDRAYDPETKLWFITERFFEPVKKLAQTIYGASGEVVIKTRADVERDEAANTAPAVVAKKPLADVCETFIKTLPYEAAQAAYRKAATLLHPDVNTEGAAKMSQLNVLWDRLKKEVYKQ